MLFALRISVLLMLLLSPGICEQWVEVPGKPPVFYDRDSFQTHKDLDWQPIKRSKDRDFYKSLFGAPQGSFRSEI